MLKLKKFHALIIVTILLLVAYQVYQSKKTSPPHVPELSSGLKTAPFYNDAPQLAELVAAGKLPPVDERLPANPMIVEPHEKIGVYGGTWRRGMVGNRDQANLIRVIGYENLVRWDEQWTRVIPNVAQSVEANDDVTEYTFRLREGMHWSDGAPFTANDILFWYKDIYSNKAFPYADQPRIFGNKDGFEVEKVDEHTVVFRFSQPNGLFLTNLATPLAADPTSFPSHYLKQFHADYNPDIDRLIAEAGVANWVELFELKFGTISADSVDHPTRWANAELPTLHAWMLTDGYSPDSEKVLVKRNPYYWKVDPDGNQLPYIDAIAYTVHKRRETLAVHLLKGEIDMQIRHITDKRATFEQNMAAGNYHLFNTIDSDANFMAISFNLAHPDPALREIFQSKDFRIGLSHAIDRPKIIDNIFAGNGQPYQVAPLPSSPHYHEQLATQYLTYDIDLANTHLDKAGYRKQGETGLRLRPDGKEISFSIIVSADMPRMVSILKDYVQPSWQKVGIDAQIKVADRGLFFQLKSTNNHDAAVWGSPGGLDVVIDPRYFFPFSDESHFAIPWALWYTNRSNPLAEPPPQPSQEQQELFTQIKKTGDPEKQNSLMARILDIAAEQFYAIGIVRPGEGFGVVKDNFYNVPKVMPRSWMYPTPAPTNPEQYFIEQQQ